MNHLLSRLDPGNAVLLVAATSAVISAIAGLSSAAMARVCRKLGPAARHDFYLGALIVILLSPAIVLGVARSGFVLLHWPTAFDQPVEFDTDARNFPSQSPWPIERPRPPKPTRVAIALDPIPPVASNSIPIPTPEPASNPSATETETAEPVAVAVASPVADGRRAWVGCLVAIWGVGFVWHFARLVRGMVELIVLRRRLRPVAPIVLEPVRVEVCRALGTKSLPPIFEANAIPGPVAWGVVWPVVALPVGMAETLGTSGLRDVLIHESAHVVRRDPLVGVLQRVAALVFWPHPLIHWLNRSLARAREEACDDMVLREADPCGYARTLLLLAEAGGLSRRLGLVVGLFETRWKLEERVAGILNRRKEPKMRTIRGLKLASLAVLALTSVAVAAIRPAEAIPTIETSAQPPLVEGAGSTILGQIVDEAGAPVAGASVNVTWFRKAPDDAKTGSDGRFTLKIPGPIVNTCLVRASIDGDRRLGITEYQEPDHARPVPIRIVLKPSRLVQSLVVDAAGKPVEGASVEVLASSSLSRGTTDATGTARLLIPADAKVDYVIALKNQVGFDYFENFRSWPSSDRDPLPSQVKLVLDGARPGSVRAVDSQGQPVAGLDLHPWFFEKPGKLSHFNSGSEIIRSTTGGDGIARFDWLPKAIVGQSTLSIMPMPWDYHAPNTDVLKLSGDRTGTLQVFHAVKLSGKVTNVDGSPAKGVLLKAMSEGKTNHYGSAEIRTDDDGRYAFLMPPNQIAMIAVIDPERAGRGNSGILVHEGEPQGGLDIQLVAGARFVARMLDQAGQPIPGATLTLTFLGAGIPDEFDGGNNNDHRLSLVNWYKANAEGVVELRLAPGDYEVIGRDKFLVGLTEEIVREYRPAMGDPNPPPLRQVKLSGLVVNATGASGQPVAGAMVQFSPSRESGGADLKALTDAEGRFEFENSRHEKKGLLVARDRSGKIAGFQVVEKASDEVKVSLAPASTVSGRVLDEKGKAVAGRQVQFAMKFPPITDNSPSVYESAATDDDGRYQFTGLIPGTRCEVTIEEEKDWRDPTNGGSVVVREFNVNGPDPITLDVTFPGGEDQNPMNPIGERFQATDVIGANPMPYAITRKEVEDLVKAIGREPANPDVLARVGRVVRPQEHWVTDLTKIRRYATDPEFIAQADRACKAVLGKPADTEILVELAHGRQVGWTEAAFRHWLTSDLTRKPGSPGRGIVEDALTSQPIAGATVFNAQAITTTDTQGRFLIAGSSRRNVWIEAEGYALAEVIPSTEPGQPTRIKLVRDQPILGQVIERNGLKPVEGAIIRAMVKHWKFLPDQKQADPKNYGIPLTARTDAQGRFVFRGLPPGLELDWFAVQHPTLRPTQDMARKLKEGEPTVLTVEVGCEVSGIVIDENGRGLADTSVALSPDGQNSDRYATTTDKEGHYRLANLPPGRFLMTVQPDRQALKRITVFAEDGRPAINQIVVEAGGTIGGKVVDAEGKPVDGATVCWPIPLDASGNPDQSNQINRFVYTEPDGTFQLGGLPPGKYRLWIATQLPPRDLKVDAPVGQADLVVTLPAAKK